jgi:hypothetical protein
VNIPGTNQPYPPFEFQPIHPGRLLYKEAAGELRVPSLVTKSRDLKAQRECSQGTGEHAGHLIGTQFGAPGDARNLGLQNPNMNSYVPKRLQEIFQSSGGSYLRLEMHWRDMLEAGVRIKVQVQDRYRPNEERPFYRRVEWWTMETGHDWVAMPTEIFGNFSSPQARAAKG